MREEGKRNKTVTKAVKSRKRFEKITTLGHASNISKTCQIHAQLIDDQISLLSHGLKFTPTPVTKTLLGASYSMTSVNLPEECKLNTYFTGNQKQGIH